ncbi:hypothetical protein L7F22_023653 [Adiantum nelumboides]|nr:hypothetical protein [Adiantum nelumboides]
MRSQKKKRKKCKVCMSWKHEVEDCPCAVDECSKGDACRKWCMVDLCTKLQKLSRRIQKASVDGTQVAWDKLEDFEDYLERAYEWLTNYNGKRRTSCSSRKEVRKLQEACDRLRDACVAEFEDESSDDDDGWVGLETNSHHVGIPKMEEKEMQKEVGQESLKLPLDTPTLQLECAHGVEMENPLLKLMSVLSLINEIYYSEEKQIIHIEDVVHKNQRPFEDADNVKNGQVDSRMNGKVMDRERNEEEEVIDLFLGSIENVCRITNEESKQEEVSKIRCTPEEFGAKTMNKSISKELSPQRSTDVNMQLTKLIEIKEDQVENQQYQQDKRQQGKEEQHEVREQSRAEILVTSILPRKCVHEAQEDYSFLIDPSVMFIGNSHTFEEDNCQQMKDVYANADIMAEFCHFKRTSKQMSKADAKTAKQQLQRQGSKDDSSITEEIENDDVHIGNIEDKFLVDKASQILEDVECDSDSNSNFTSDSVSILDLDSIAILDAKINSDANFNGSRGKLDEEAKDIATNDEVIFGNAAGAKFYHGNCQVNCQVGNQADDVNVEVEDVRQNADLMSKFRVLLRILNHAVMMIQRLTQVFDLQGETNEYAELNTVKSGAAEKEQNVAGGVEVAVGIQDLQKDLKSGSRIAELQTKLEKAIFQGREMTGVLVADLMWMP